MTLSSWGLVALGARIATAGIARPTVPSMGWNSYNYYNCIINETVIKENAKGLVDLGFADLGYTIVTPDCGWTAYNRTSDGSMTWDTTRFPSGYPALGQYLHGMGLHFGIYGGGGVYQCGSGTDGVPPRPGSLNNEDRDAQLFASWGADFLKYDNCWPTATIHVEYNETFEADPSRRFVSMANALQKVNRTIEYNICQWGVGFDLGEWAPRLASSWRMSNDIQNNWKSVWRIVNQVVPFAKVTGVGKYADMDMMIVGIKAARLTEDEERLHFAFWAINKSPLKIGAPINPRITPNSSLAILANKEIIALNQDPLGEQAQLIRRYTEEGYDIWAGNLSSNRKVVALANWGNAATTVSVNMLNEVGIVSASVVRDVWNAADLGALADGSKALNFTLRRHEARILVLSGVQLATSPQKTQGSAYFAAANGTFAAGARIEACTKKTDDCLPVKAKVTGLSEGGKLTIRNVKVASAGSRLVGVDFINWDIALGSAWQDGSNTRNITFSVNGGKAKRWALPISGGDWYETGRLDVVLDGFREGASNEIVVARYGTDPAPDVVGLEVYA